MDRKKLKSRQWWQMLPLFVACMLAGSSSLWAGVHFNSNEGKMTVVHNPTLEQPYIVVDVLYFDAYGGDGYFTTANTEGNHPGAAVYVNGEYICSPSELTWNGNQSGANNWRDKNGWAGSTYNETNAVVRFWDPRHEAEKGEAEDRYRVHMYIFLKNWQADTKYTVKVKGTWKINAKNGVPGSEQVEQQEVETAAFPNPWSEPTKLVMTNANTVKVSGGLSTAYGPTRVGFDTGTTLPTAFNSNPSSYKDYQTQSGTDAYVDQVCNNFTIANASGDNYKSPRKLNVQYSFVVTHEYSGNYNMNVYKWFSKAVTGFMYPYNVTVETSNLWTKKVKVSWSGSSGSNRCTNGTWTVKAQYGDYSNEKTGISSSSRSAEIALPNEYDYGKDYTVRVYFIPNGYTGSTLPFNMGASTTYQITPEWHFDSLEAEEIPQGQSDAGKVKLTWKFPSLENASATNIYRFTIQRSENNVDYLDLKDQNNSKVEIEVTDSKIDSLTFVDKTVESSKTYYYKVKLNIFGSDVLSGYKQIRSGGSKIKSFSATRGSYSNLVKLQWTISLVGSSANFVIQRRPLGSSSDRDWADIYTTTGSATNYSYDDVTALPGSFNDYKIIIRSQDQGVWHEDDSRTTDGFSLTTGIISGNVAYGTGTAVEGAKVTLKQQSVDGGLVSGMHSLLLSGIGTGIKYAADSLALAELFKGDFSIQMYINPNGDAMAEAGTDYTLFDVEGVLSALLKRKSATVDSLALHYSYNLPGMGTLDAAGLTIPAGEWSHVSIVYTNSDGKLKTYLTKGDATDSIVSLTRSSIWGKAKANCMVIGNNKSMNADHPYNGNIDEFRFFTKALTKQDILRNYSHPLAGNEGGLAIYYPLDEGITKQTIAYDFSRKNGISNGRHAQAKAVTSDLIPGEDQLSLMAYTDVNGYYEIRGVPFLGEGTSYSVIPTMGIHEFSPSQQSRYVSSTTLNHSSVNFEDVSSFPVSGRVFYAGSDYPVEGVNFYVDGNICAKDGEVIQSDANGEFTISVPIGDHFITVKKNGHVFAYGGRYPADDAGVGTKHTFNQELKNMEFVDETLVNFTGRVVGGKIQGDKAVGFGLSENNIGVAQLVLTPLNANYRMNVKRVEQGTTFSYEINDTITPVSSATDRIKSTAWRGAGNMVDCKRIFIQTDPNTGEFSAMLPPLEFNVATITLVNKQTDNELEGSSTTIDLTSPLIEYNDTLHNDDGTDELYPYNTMMKYVYHSTPTFIVTQADHVNEATQKNDGAFGIMSYQFQEEASNTVYTVDDIYQIGTDGKPLYKYGKGDDAQGAAVFIMDDRYTFNIEAYEEYTNVDRPTVTDHVPLAGVVVTIQNALSDQQPIVNDESKATADALAAAGYEIDSEQIKAGQVAELQSNQLKLDDDGRGVYTWTAGLPNVTAPYTRTITITYDIDSRTYPWSGNGMKGIVLGNLPTGNDFITSGPDVVDMILRDPPGSNSYAEWTSGTITNLANEVTAHYSSTTGLNTVTKLGVSAVTCSGVGVAVINSMEAENDMTLGVKAKVENEGGHKWSRSVEATKTISTSDSPDYVGADADVFIGSATNIIFGAARSVDFRRDDQGNIVLNEKSVISTGLSFGTMFNYTQGYIKYELFLKLEQNRNALLIHVDSEEAMNAYVNNTSDPVYLTLLTPSDPRYGSNNNDKSVWGDEASAKGYEGKSYKMVVPQSAIKNGKNTKNFEDKVAWHNNQIAAWKSYLKQNEEHKVKAFNKRMQGDGDFKNFSFDAGAKINSSVETVDTHGGQFKLHGEAIINFGLTWGVEFDKSGVLFDTTNETTIGLTEAFEGSTGDKTVFTYTLADGDAGDAFTVDVYDYDSFGPIFRTRGGQSSAPYEGRVVTDYYEPGTTIMEATLQIDMPQIGVDVATVTDVPTGSAAAYTLRLGNASEANRDVTYRLSVIDATNPDGAVLSIDGQVLTESRLINVPAGQTLKKTLLLRQGSEDVLSYTDIGLQFSSVSQPSDINAQVFISASFAASSSPVTLELNKTLMNTTNGSDLRLTFKDFDRNYKNLKAFRLQYKQPGAADWTQLKEYVLGTATGNQLELPEGSSVTYTLPMAQFSDGEYLFRVVSASSNGKNEEVYRYSNEIALVKDMQKPTPLGQPEPADGVLNIGDDLSVTFNEIILNGELTKTKNFRVTGVLNGSPVAHWTALSMQGTAAAASTEASINLADKDFSFDAWVNLTAGSEGIILSHGGGTLKFTVGLDATGHLVVTVAGISYTSAATVPTGKWVFLTLNYQNADTGALLSASVASDATETSLFSGQAVSRYDGNGPLVVGKDISGAIHELLLWDVARDLTTALASRSVTKSPSTRHLIGYWKMDEGEGREVRDYSRNRHMSMPDATWYLNNANKAVALDGQHYLSIDASTLPVCVDDDYAVEFWMKGASQSDAQLFQMGEVALWVKADGTLQLTGRGAYNDADGGEQVLATSAAGLTDGAWHHVALNVLRQGAAAVYVDGVRRLTVSASAVGSITTNALIIGARRITQSAETATYTFARPFTGWIDEVRVWNATINGDLLTANRKVRLTGEEDGLVAYYPFETQTLDSGNQVQAVGSAADLTGSGLTAQLFTLAAADASLSFTDEAPAMRQKPIETNVSFSFVASNEKVVFTIDENPATIEGCTLHFTVQSVGDVNGNYSDPAVWSAYVNRNELVWADDALAVTQPVRTTSSVTATIVNKGGKQQMWTLAGLPSWLTASAEYGTTNPLSETKVTFSVSESTAVGNYEETIYLVADNGIETPLTLHVKVTGNVPEWTVNPKDFELAMSLIGRLDILGLESEDEDDIVAAFVGEECRGVAHPVYNKRYDSYYVTMDIYSNQPETVTFRAYDASAGIIYPLVDADNAQSITFEQFALKGSYATPVNLAAQDKIEQSIQLGKGWNWLSLGITTDDMSVPAVLSGIIDDVMTVKGQTIEEPLYILDEGTFDNYSENDSLSNTKMYAVQMAADRTLRIVGRRVNPDATKVSLEPGWNWIGYYGLQLSSVTDAFAGMSPVDGDFVKAQTGVAYYDSYAWEGSLATLIPGQGYVVNSSKAVAFSYPAKSLASWAPGRTARGADASSAAMVASAKADAGKRADDVTVFTPVDYHRYSSNMVLVAKVEMEGEPLSGVELGVFAGDECRSTVVTGDDGMACLLIPGDDDATLTFRVALSETLQGEAEETVDYKTDAVIGSRRDPFVIRVTTTGIDSLAAVEGEVVWYDLSGRRLEGAPTDKGIYIATVTSKAGTVSQRLVRK